MRHHQPPAAGAKINVTPLIDVVMVLIIFYLIVGKMASERQGHVKLPASGTGVSVHDQAPVIVTVMATEGGRPLVIVDGHEVPEGGLENVLKARVGSAPGTTAVQVRADRRLPYADVSPVIKACRDVGLTSLRLVTEKVGGGGGSGGGA